MHDQEVVRAKKELAAYFKGLRTEREARSALKTLKAFVRDREKTAPAKRRPLPGMKPTITVARRKRRKATRRRRPQEISASVEPQVD